MFLGEYINWYRTENKLTMQDLANKCKLSKGYISMLENNFIPTNTGKKITPSISAIKKLADGMNVDFDYLLSLIDGDISFIDSDRTDDHEEYSNIYKIDKLNLPLLGKVACGEPIYADHNLESYIMRGTELKADFCLKCQGDSMINARINDGDIVFIRKQDIVNNGEIAVVIIDDEATLKRFYFYKEKNMVILRPENPKYKDIILTGEELNNVKILGKAIAFQSDVI